MTDLLGAGLAWLDQQRERFLARPVIYRRPAVGGLPAQEVTVPATVGRTVFRLEMGMGAVERVEARDYLITAAHLVALGLPQRGDRVVEEAGGQRHTYEVLAPGREPPWRWSDPDRRTYRIHTKLLTTETIP
ncbi:MAG: hypothetical protein L6R48_20860 [Planctomycetes bacterium]|nr:hypothetical protein [Planctomycetota bacterium]